MLPIFHSDETQYMIPTEVPPGGLFLSQPQLTVPPEALPFADSDLSAIRAHIDLQIPRLICYPEDITNKLAIPLKHPFMVPSVDVQEGFSYKQQQFGWDSFFHGRLLMLKDQDSGYQRDSLFFRVTLGMLDNAIDMYEQFGINPNSSLYIRLGHAQPPLLTSLIFEIYDTYKDVHPDLINREWLTSKIAVAKREYASVWMGTEDPHHRLMYRGLSRYYDPDLTDDHVQAESGHDYTPRFDGEAYDYVPADLNALLYKYERDFAREAGLRGDKLEMTYWLEAAETRRATMNELMYDATKGVYHDLNFRTGKWGPVDSLASYVTMWAGMVERRSEQAEQMVQALRLFEHVGGLAVTEAFQMPSHERRKLQWADPNSWSPNNIFTTDGLEIAGYPEEARRIALKSLAAKVGWFMNHGVVLEAYNAREPHKMPAPGMYPRQIGFGFTDAEIEYYSARYVNGLPLPAQLMREAVLLDPN